LHTEPERLFDIAIEISDALDVAHAEASSTATSIPVW
jgi:hypothetical protein